jgi:hypothetical protein
MHPKLPVKQTQVVAKQKTVKPVSLTVASNLTGLQVSREVNNRPVTGVMIENSTFARPQSGRRQAGIVFEAVAEGGITRFLALYQDIQPDYVGPVRSVRPYYLLWDLGFDAPIAHVGGSPEALADISTWGAKDLDQFFNANYYQRISSRVAPHNVYTNIAQLNNLESSRNYKPSVFTGFLRKPDSPSKQPSASSIDLSISSSDYNPHYDYSAVSNTYTRNISGQPDQDLLSSGSLVPITPKVVIAMVMQQGIEADDKHTSYNTIGSGQVYIFQDGNVTTGTWQKAGIGAQITFTDANNQPIKLNAGQTWLTAVGSPSNVSYK